MVDPPGFRWKWEDPATAKALREVAHSMARSPQQKAAEVAREGREALAQARAARPHSDITAQMKTALARLRHYPSFTQRRS